MKDDKLRKYVEIISSVARTAVYKLGVLCFVKSLYKENLDSGISICMVRHTNNKSLKHQGETLGGVV